MKQKEDEEDVWYHKEKLFNVSAFIRLYKINIKIICDIILCNFILKLNSNFFLYADFFYYILYLLHQRKKLSVQF